jgi:hypothetical protein
MGFGKVMDLDQVEYIYVDGRLVPVAIIELTRRDPHPDHPDPTPGYFAKVHETYSGSALLSFGKLLGVDVYVVAYESGMERLWVCNLTRGDEDWQQHDNLSYQLWLAQLHMDTVEKNRHPGNTTTSPGPRSTTYKAGPTIPV